MNVFNAEKQLKNGDAYADKGQQRCGLIFENKVVFELKFPYSSAIESLTEDQLKDIAYMTRDNILSRL